MTEVARGCVLLGVTAGEVGCWGTFWGRPAPGTPDEAEKVEKARIEASLGNSVTSVAFLKKDSCAVSGGILECIRTDQAGTDARPIDITAGGGEHACLTVKATHSPKVRCLGDNSAAQLGTGKVGGPRADTPAGEVVGLSYDTPGLNIIQIAAGLNHTLVLYDNGKVYAWGANNNGQIGNGSPGDPVTSPVQVPLPGDANFIAAGGNHSCAVLADKTAWCWGENAAGELGFSPQ